MSNQLLDVKLWAISQLVLVLWKLSMVSVYELRIGSIQRKVTNDCEEKGVFGQEYPLLSKITDYYTCQEMLERFGDFQRTW